MAEQNKTYGKKIRQPSIIENTPLTVKRVIKGVAVCWALFQLLLPRVLIIDSITVRAVHLAFAFILVFFAFPGAEAKNRIDRPGQRSFIPIRQLLLALAGAVAALYITIDWHGIAVRSGIPIARDIFFGLLLVIILLEASRRAIGQALSLIAILFSLYAFLGPLMPDVLAFKGVSVRKFITQVSLSTEGIYGIPLGVSASVVYLFVLLGALLDRAGAGQFFIDLALSVFGRFRGGPAKAAVAASGFIGLISGSSIANIVTTGTFTIPLMKRVGYPAKKAAAIEVAASTDGQLMPPIMGAAAFIIAEYVNVPFIEVVKAAAIPALVSYCALFYITHLEAIKLGIIGLTKTEVPAMSRTLKTGAYFLIPLFVLLVELIVLRHSPELSAFKAIITLLLVTMIREILLCIRGKKPLRQAILNFFRITTGGFVKGSLNMIPVALATAAAGIIVGIVSTGIGGMITQIVEYLSGGNVFLLLMVTALASLLLGMGLPTTATYIVMASLTAPIIVQLGIAYGYFVPIIAAHLFCFYFGILADDTPPVGLASYAAAAIAGSEPIPTGLQGFFYDLRTAIIPFMFIFNTDLILYGINHWALAALIFIMAVLGAFSFTSMLQGYFISRNRWYEIPFFCLASLALFNPHIFSSLFQMEGKKGYFCYFIGIGILAVLALEQKLRKSRRDRFHTPV